MDGTGIPVLPKLSLEETVGVRQVNEAGRTFQGKATAHHRCDM